MAQIINLNQTHPTDGLAFSSPCQQIGISVANIQDVKDYVDSAYPGTRSVLNVKYVQANHFKSKLIYVNETKAAIITAAG